MKKIKLKILSTKNLLQQTLDKASINDIETDELSFITTEAITTDELKMQLKSFLQQNIAAVFTSKTAVKAFEQIVNADVPWKIFCIGQSTKDAVSKLFGEESISGIADNAANLGEVILQDEETRKVIFFCGKQKREELPKILKEGGKEIEEVVVYETHETPRKISRKHYEGILFLSPSAVTSFFSLNKLNEQIQVFAIGSTTANTVKQFCKNDIIVAEIPSEENLIEQVILHLSTAKTI